MIKRLLPAKCQQRHRCRGASIACALLLALDLGFQSGLAAETREPFQPLVMVTNISQLERLVQNDWRLRCNLRLEGVVCSVSVAKQVLVLADGSGAELLNFEFGEPVPAVGQKISLVMTDCEVTRRREGLALGRAPLLEDDGIHPAREVSANVELDAGWIPIRVEWFNDKKSAVLTVSHAEPGEDLVPISDSALACSVSNGVAVEPGVKFDGYEGGWGALPDFGRLPVGVSGVTNNFDISVRSRADYVGVVFSGWFNARSSGRHTFRLRSDDGSRLILGDRTPVVTVLGEAKVPTYRQYFIGQVVGDADAYVWTRAYGDVRRVETQDGRMELELHSPREGRLQVAIMDSQGIAPALLLNNRVSVIGVSRRVIVPGGQQIFGLVTAASEHEMELLEAAAEVWSANPPRRIGELPDPFTAPLNGMVLCLQGRLEMAGENTPATLCDETGVIALASDARPARNLMGTNVQCLAFCEVVEGAWRVQRGFFRAVPQVESVDAARLPLLTTAQEILQLKRDEAEQAYPARLRGVVTCLWRDSFRNAILQDATRGIFLNLPESVTGQGLEIGDFWEIEGTTAVGDFAPILNVSRLTRLGEGRMPEPVRPFWDQLISGSLDAQYVEIEGIITRVVGENAQLLTYWGQIEVAVVGRVALALEKYNNRLVKLRGCLLASWDANSGQLRVGELRLGGATVTLSGSDAEDSFSAPVKTLSQLLRFDLRAGLFQRVRLTGQLVGLQGDELFLSTPDGGCRVVASASVGLKPGDLLEVAGFPQIDGPSPILHQADVRKVGIAPLPHPRRLGLGNLLNADNDALLVSAEATLLGQRTLPNGTALLELQDGVRSFVARTAFQAGRLPKLTAGSRLSLTGIFIGQGSARLSSRKVDSFELMLISPEAVRVEHLPPWWTLRRLAIVLSVLVAVLAASMLWAFQLRRRVEAQTVIIREKVERAATLEERTRIARELHDTLEQALAGLSFQLGAFATAVKDLPGEAREILGRARQMVRHGQEEARRSVRNLRMFELEGGDLPGALQQLAQDANNGLTLKTETSVEGQPTPLSGQTENHLLRIAQEAMTNALKHGQASVIRFTLRYGAERVELQVTDNGCGFDSTGTAPPERGHFGLLGMRERANKIRGTLTITSQPGQGTTVLVQMPHKKDISDSKSA